MQIATVDAAVGPAVTSAEEGAVAAGGGEVGTVRSTVGPGCLAAISLDPFAVAC
jgi:hypothetical protein